MRQPTIDLVALDAIWFALRDDILAAIRNHDSHAKAIANVLPSARHTRIEWSPGSGETLISEFRGLAHCVGNHAQAIFTDNALPIKIDFERVVSEYIGFGESSNRHYGEKMQQYILRASSLSVVEVWARLCDAYPETKVEQLALDQAGARLRSSFDELSPRRRRENSIRRTSGRDTLTLTLYGETYDQWHLSWGRQDSAKKALLALSDSLLANGESDAAAALASAATAFLAIAGERTWQYSSRMRQQISEDLELIFFKERIQFVLSQRLSMAIKLLLAQTEIEDAA